jgi:sugar-phosphatase
MSATETARDLYLRAAGLLIDLDGTLVESSAPVQRVWTAFAGRQGLDPAQVLAVAHGRPSRETVQQFAPAAAHAAEIRRLEEAECTDTAGTFALPGADTVLCSGRPLAIVTSCSARLAGVRLGAAGLTAPEILISADDVVRGKPDPECFLIGARALGLEPGQCLVLEDSPAGIAAARAAGMPVVAVRSTHQATALEQASAVVSGLAELVADL